MHVWVWKRITEDFYTLVDARMPDVSCVDRKIQEVPRGPSVADLTEIWIRYVFSSAMKILHEPIFFFVQKFCGNIETKFVTISFTFDLSRPHLEKKSLCDSGEDHCIRGLCELARFMLFAWHLNDFTMLLFFFPEPKSSSLLTLLRERIISIFSHFSKIASLNLTWNRTRLEKH